MSLTDKQIDEFVREIVEAQRTAKTVTSMTERFPDITVPEAYSVQMRMLRLRGDAGEVIVGRKIGLSAKALQERFGVNEPIYGHYFASMVVPEGEPITMSRLLHPFIEGEICFVLKQDLKGPGIDVGKVLAATAGVMPAIEIPDSCLKERTRKVQDAICMNSNATLVVLGGRLTPIDNIDLRLVGMVLEKNGEVIATGAGATVLGNPAQPVANLANKLAEYGMKLSAGEFVMSGCLHMPSPAEAGACFRATFDRIGSVTARFVE